MVSVLYFIININICPETDKYTIMIKGHPSEVSPCIYQNQWPKQMFNRILKIYTISIQIRTISLKGEICKINKYY